MKTIKSFLSGVYFSSKVIFLVAYSLVAVILIFTLSYFLGHQLLGGIMMGSDSSFALTVMTHLAKWFPKIPLWYPYQGAGQSMTLGYYTLTYYVPIILEKVTSLDLVQSMRLVAFLTVPIIGIELYFYCLTRLKNPTIGLIAGLMYPLSSASWAWMTHGGFYAMSLSLVFIVPAFTFLDWHLDLHLQGANNRVKKKLALAGSVVFVGFAIASHLAVGTVFLLGAGFYTLFRSQLKPLGIARLKSFFISTAAFILVVALGVGFSSFYFLPQRHYSNQIAEDIIPVYGPDIPQFEFSAFLGIRRHDAMFDSIYQPMFLSYVITFFAGIGLILALVKREKVAALGVSILILAFITSITKWINGLSYFWSVFMLPTNVRLAAFVFVMVPVVAAYGIWSVSDLPFWLIRKFLSLLGVKKENFFKIVVFLPVSLISIVIFIYGLYHFRFQQRWPAGEYNQFAYSGYGPMVIVPSFCILPFMEYTPPVGTTCEETLPAYKIDSIGRDLLPEMQFDEFLQRNNFNQFTRTDVSTHLGLLTATANLHTDASMINSYNGIGALIYKWWGHQARAMFLDGDFDTDVVSEMAKYFGIRYIFLHAGDDEKVLYRYPETLWKDVDKLGGAVLVKEYIGAEGLAIQFSKPAILVIGNSKKNAYEQIFKLAYLGGLSFDQGLIVEGREDVDNYTLDELKMFDALVLHGYSYKSKSKAYSLLNKYVEDGGSLFVNTGWQYVAKDWGSKSKNGEEEYISDFSDPFPVSQSTWGSIGNSWDGAILSRELGFTSDLKSFVTPVWENYSWQMSLSQKSKLATWAKPILSLGDAVIIAGGSYGKGKVVWTGFNILAHAVDKNSQEELLFINELFDYLLPAKESLDSGIFLSRNYPDEISFSFGKGTSQPSWLYFRESYTRDWRPELKLASGKVDNVEIYKAGPGLTLIRLPQIDAGSKLKLTYSLGGILPVSIAITLAVITLLGLLLVDSIFFGGKVEKGFMKLLPFRRIKLFKMVKILGHEDE